MRRIKVSAARKTVTVPAWDEAVEMFLLHKRAQGRAEATLTGYRECLSTFRRRFPDAWPDNIQSACLAFLGNAVSPATYNFRLNTLKHFCAFCVTQGFLSENPVAQFKARKKEPKAKEIDIEILRKLLKLPRLDTWTGLRDYALILLTLDTGIRPSEARQLLINDFDFRTNTVTIQPHISKTRTGRILPILSMTADAIQKLIRERHPQWGETVPVFCNWDGKPLTRNAWRLRLRHYRRQLGIAHLRPYDLRHAFATLFLRQGGNAIALQRILGHTTMTMTKHYVHLTQSDLEEQHRLASPVLSVVERRGRKRKI